MALRLIIMNKYKINIITTNHKVIRNGLVVNDKVKRKVNYNPSFCHLNIS